MNKLQSWINAHLVDDEMRWKGAFGHQMSFIRDRLVPLMGEGLIWQEQEAIVDVISTHRSKSIILPVVEVTRQDLGLRFTMRDNFHNWKLSVRSEKPIEADFAGLFHTTPPLDKKYTGDALASVYFEGFPEDRIYRYYEENKREFSAEIDGDNALWTTVYLIMRAIGAVQPLKWHTEATHREEMDARSAREKAWSEKHDA